MNTGLLATFTAVTQGLLSVFGRPVLHSAGGGASATVLAVIREAQDALALSDPFPQRQWTARVAKSAGVAPGHTLTEGADVWRIEGILSDDGFVVTLAIRQVTP